jgi:hypothetical protein
MNEHQPKVDTTRATGDSPLPSGQDRDRNGGPSAEAAEDQGIGVEVKPKLSKRARAVLRDMKVALDTEQDLFIAAFHLICQTVLEEEGIGVEELLPMIGRNRDVDRVICRMMRGQ